MRHRVLLSIVALLGAGVLLCAHELFRLPDGTLRVTFLDVGQGDASFITTPSGRQILIDGGPDESALRGIARHMPFLDRRIDLLILSHPQLDHMAAFPEILRRYRVDRVLMTGVQYDLPQYRETLSLIHSQRIPIWLADPRKDIDLGDGVILDIVWPSPSLFGQSMKQVNNSSIILRVIHGSGSVLFTGDAEEVEERAALASGADVHADVLKAGHHGSKTSSGTGFLLVVDPNVAVVSASKINRYGHPHAIILERLRTLGIPVRVTGWDGEIEVMW